MLVSSVLIHEQVPLLPISGFVRSTAVSEALRELGVNQTISLDDLVAHTMAKSLAPPHSRAEPPSSHDSPIHHLVEVEVDAATVGKPFSAVRSEREGTSARPCEVPDGISLGIGEHPRVAEGDKLLIAEPLQMQRGLPSLSRALFSPCRRALSSQCRRALVLTSAGGAPFSQVPAGHRSHSAGGTLYL